MLVCLAVSLTAVVTINLVVNPYGVWRTTVVDRAYRLADAGADEIGERLSTPYRVRAEQPSTLLVGSSRVLKGMLVAQSVDDTFLNASLSGATLAELRVLLRRATVNPRLRRVIWGVDFYAFDDKLAGFLDRKTVRRLEADERHALTLRIKETLFNMRAFRDSRRVLARAALGDKPVSLAYPVPWPEPLIRERLTQPSGRTLDRVHEGTVKRQLQNWMVSYVGYRLSDRQLSTFRQSVENLRRAGLEVILFVPPLSRCELESIDQSGTWHAFQNWKRALLVAGPYWDFSGYGKLDRTPDLFVDVPHFKPAVGQVILRALLGMDCNDCGETARIVLDAGVWVEAASVDSYLAGQEASRAASRRLDDRCVRVVEDMLRDRAASARRPPA